MSSQPIGFAGKQPRHQAVNQPMIDFVFRSLRFVLTGWYFSPQPNPEKHGEVGITDSLDGQANSFGCGLQFGQTVAAFVPRLVIVLTPTSSQSWDVNYSRSAGLQSATVHSNLLHRRPGVRSHPAQYQVKSFVAKGNSVALAHIVQS